MMSTVHSCSCFCSLRQTSIGLELAVISYDIFMWLVPCRAIGAVRHTCLCDFVTQRHFVSLGHLFSDFVTEQVTNRTALCRLLNGTCVVPANCAVLGLTLGYAYGRGSPSDIGKYFSCDASTICCYPFLLSSLALAPVRHHGNDEDYHQLEGFQTVYEYWYPNDRQQRPRWRRRQQTRSRYDGRRRGNYRDSRRKHHSDRSAIFRFLASA